jgi:hypothetical protein
MSKTTLRNVKASIEVRELKDELNEAELGAVSGGTMVEALARIMGELLTARYEAIRGLR